MVPMPSSPSRLAPHLVVAVALLLSTSCALLGADAAVHEYAGERFYSGYDGNAFVLHGGSEGVYASAAAGAFIRFEKVVFKRTAESAAAAAAEEDGGNRTATVTAVIFEAGNNRDGDVIGGTDDDVSGGRRVLCCTPDMARHGDCTEGAVVTNGSTTGGWVKVVGAASFLPGSLRAAFPDETVPVSRTGMYTLLFVHCGGGGQVLAAEAEGGGKTIWRNSRGYLPGRMAPLLPFYGCMSLAFAALAAYWFAQHARFWRAAPAPPPFQSCCATLVIALGMAECAARYLDLAEFNESGVRPRGATLWAATAGALRGAASRVLLLLVAMGHGVVVRPAALVSSAPRRVAGLGAAYFVAAEALEVAGNVGTVSDHSPSSPATRLLFSVLPVAALNTVFICWIFTSLSRTVSKLKARRMTLKLEMYRKLTNALIIAVALSLGWITFEIHFKWTSDEYNERWRAAWVIPAAWQLISFSLLCAVCLIWAPSHISTRYAYSSSSEEESEEYCDDVEDTTRPLMRPAGPLSYVDNWAISVSRDDDTKVILRTDSGGVYAKAAGDGGNKRV